jgi:hypothetical protein
MCGQDLTGSGEGSISDSYEQSNESSCPLQGKQFLGTLSNYKLLKEDFIPLRIFTLADNLGLPYSCLLPSSN